MQKLYDRDLWLEAALWLVLAFVLVQYATSEDGDLITLAGIIGLLAIGVRATRSDEPSTKPKEEQRSDAGNDAATDDPAG